LHAVEPDLDVRPLGPDAICVPLAGLEGAARLLVPLALERHQPAAAALVVETSRPGPLARVDLGLIAPEPVRLVVRAKLNAAVAALGHPHLHLEDEVVIGRIG